MNTTVELSNDQLEAIGKMHNGCILCGGTGSGKSRTSLAYFFMYEGGHLYPKMQKMRPDCRDLYIITTAVKRDAHDWDEEMLPFGMCVGEKGSNKLYPGQKIVVDSWNNIQKYKNVTCAFFIFDEQRVTGKGKWVKAFLRIAHRNKWILLSATPGDKYEDYIPVFLANGFYKSKQEFNQMHCVFNPYTTYPKIDRFVNTKLLDKEIASLLVDIKMTRSTYPHHSDIFCGYDIAQYKQIMKNRWNIFENEPIVNAAELCFVLRKVVNSHEDRILALKQLLESHPKAIIFYNYDFELEILRNFLNSEGYLYGERNGHRHDELPTGEKWVFLVHYASGAEGWNCVTCDTVIFFSQSYSYKATVQACGRIDRRNTPFLDLYYYHFKSRSPIDLAISRALNAKKEFNESKFIGRFEGN